MPEPAQHCKVLGASVLKFAQIGMPVHLLRQQPLCRPSTAIAAYPAQHAQPTSHSWRHRKFARLSQKGRDNIGIIEEEDDINVVEESFRQAYRNSQADTICVPGLQEFAGSIWARRRNISSYQDPLEHIFSEFDEDQDGYLNAEDVTAALGSRNVNITPEQAQIFLEVSDVDSDHVVGKHEFADFIFHMAAADLAHGSEPSEDSAPQAFLEPTSSTIDSPNEQRTLSDFLDEGDLAAGLQAWLKLTNNTISGVDNDICLTEDDAADVV